MAGSRPDIVGTGRNCAKRCLGHPRRTVTVIVQGSDGSLKSHLRLSTHTWTT